MTGHLILIMAPSGSGKGVLIKYLRETQPDVYFAVSCTTRPPRPGEKEGEVYYFLSQKEFDKRIKEGKFLEWAEFSGNRYGTLKSEILEPLREGRVVLREVELQGILAIRKCVPENHRTVVYVDAGSWETLKARVLKRAPISEEHLELRHKRYLEESKWKEFADVIIHNEDGKLDVAKQALTDLIHTHLKK